MKSSSSNEVFLSPSTGASVRARGFYMEVKTEMSKMLFEALKKIWPNPSDAPVILVNSKWRITETTTSILSLNNWKIEKKVSAVLKNKCNWSKRMHEAIFEVARWDHVVHKEVVWSCVLKRQWASARTFSKHFEGWHWSGYCPKNTELASSVLSCILGCRKTKLL